MLSVHCSSLPRVVGVAGIVHADDAAANTTQVASHYLDNANKPTGNLTLMMQQLKSKMTSRGDGSFLWSEANKATVRVGQQRGIRGVSS